MSIYITKNCDSYVIKCNRDCVLHIPGSIITERHGGSSVLSASYSQDGCAVNVKVLSGQDYRKILISVRIVTLNI